MGNYQIYCRRSTKSTGKRKFEEEEKLDGCGEEEILLDCNLLAKGEKTTFFQIGEVKPSPTHSLLSAAKT